MKPTLVFERPGKVPFSDYRSTIALKKKAWGSVYGGWAPGPEKLRRKQRDRDEGSWYGFRPYNNGSLHHQISMREMPVI